MTLKDIAEMAKVSSATVSKVLNGKDEHISDATRQRILDIVEREGYIPNAIAKSLKMKQTKTLGIIIPDVMNLFFSELARGIEDAAEKKGYSVILCNTDNKIQKEEKYIQMLQEKMVDGIILTAAEQSVSKSLKRRNTPIVLLDRDLLIDEEVGRIVVDNMEGAFNATKFLVEKGCRNIGFISSDDVNKSSGQRLEGYKNAILANDLEIDNEIIYLESYSIETGYKGTMKILEKKDIDGICCGNDLIAIGAIKALKEREINVPRDVKVIGFDDIQISQYMDPPLTTIKQPIYEMGEEAVKMLIGIINGKGQGSTKILRTRLIERGSS